MAQGEGDDDMQLVILSGKGGTGKTTLAASFAYLAPEAIKCDCDVDASNLHLVLGGKDKEQESFSGAKVAHIDDKRCVRCGVCEQVCRFNAIKDNMIQPLLCEGCGACQLVCKEKAISLNEEITGHTFMTETHKGLLSRAELLPGGEGSGKLVTKVRKNALKKGLTDNLYLLDGTPGVGCAVMASTTGCDVALLVVEPTKSGLNDFKRVHKLVQHFGIPAYVCINKSDINTDMTEEIKTFCHGEKLQVIGEIPFDSSVQKSINEGQPVVVYEESIASQCIKSIWKQLQSVMIELI